MRLLSVFAAASLLGCASYAAPASTSTSPVLVVREGPPVRTRADRKAERRRKRAHRASIALAVLGLVDVSLSTAVAIKEGSAEASYEDALCEEALD